MLNTAPDTRCIIKLGMHLRNLWETVISGIISLIFFWSIASPETDCSLRLYISLSFFFCDMPGPVHICSETLVNMASVFIQDLRVFNQDQTTSSCSNVIGARWFMDSGGQIRRALSWFDLGTDTDMIRTVYWYLLILPWNIDPRKNIHSRSMVCGENEIKGRGMVAAPSILGKFLLIRHVSKAFDRLLPNLKSPNRRFSK